MLIIKIEPCEKYSEADNEFYNIPETTLHLEHSLISLSKWEAKYHKPFLQNSDKLSAEEILYYVKCMTMSPSNVADKTYLGLSQSNIQSIIEYIKNPMTATWFNEDKPKKGRPMKETITSELVYYWMVTLQIPFECQKWHLNRLLTLIRVCNEKNAEQDPKNKIPKRELMSRNAALNAQRRAKLHSKG